MKKKSAVVYNVILWDINSKRVEYYDIIPFLIEEWNDLMKHKRRKDFHKPEGFDEIKEWVRKQCQWRFWSDNTYEILVSSWPEGFGSEVIDAYEQILANLDIVTECFIKSI